MPDVRIAFTGNHSRTDTFACAARFIMREGVSVSFIMPGADFRIKRLMQQGITDILNLSKSPDIYDESVLAELERFSEVSVSYIIMSDRILSRKKTVEAMSYLCGIYLSVKKFLCAKGIKTVFSEATWAFELVTAAACRAVGADFLVPHTVRYPEGRFAFFRGIFQKDIVNTGNFRRKESVKYDGVRIDSPKLLSFRNFSGLVRHAGNIRNMKDSVSFTPYELVKDRLFRFLNAVTCGFDKMPDMPCGRYVYFPLHCQPEASIDVLGGYYSDQLNLIKNTARALPAGIKLAVKEHPAGVGMRGRKFFRELEKLPNVININPAADSSRLINKASAVISVSGTACYEAAMCGIGAIVFTDLYFDILPSVFRCRSFEDLGITIKKAMSAEPDDSALAAFAEYIVSVSYPGCVEPADFFPQAKTEENAGNISQAFLDVIYYSSSEEKLTAASISSRCS